MKLCSKSTKSLVDSVPVHFSKVTAVGYEWEEDCPDPPYLSDSAQVCFSMGDTHVWRNGSSNRIAIGPHRRSLRYDTADEADEMYQKLFIKIMSDKNVTIDHIQYFWSYSILAEDMFPGSIQAEKIEIVEDYNNNYEACLRLFSPGAKTIVLSENTGCPTNYVNYFPTIMMPVTINAEELTINSFYIKEGEIEQFNGRKLTIAYAIIKETGIRTLMKKWIDNDYPVGTTLDINEIEIEKGVNQCFNVETLLEGLQGWLWKPKNEYDTEYRAFVHLSDRKCIKLHANKESYSANVYATIIEGSAEELYNRWFAKSEVYKRQKWKYKKMEIDEEIVKEIIDRMDVVTRSRLKKCTTKSIPSNVSNSLDVNKDSFFDGEIVKFSGKNWTICKAYITQEDFRKRIQKWIDNDYPVGASMDILTWYFVDYPEGMLDGLRGWGVRMLDNEYRGVIHMNNRKYIKFRVIDEGYTVQVLVEICECPSIRESYNRLFANSEIYKRKNLNHMKVIVNRKRKFKE